MLVMLLRRVTHHHTVQACNYFKPSLLLTTKLNHCLFYCFCGTTLFRTQGKEMRNCQFCIISQFPSAAVSLKALPTLPALRVWTLLHTAILLVAVLRELASSSTNNCTCTTFNRVMVLPFSYYNLVHLLIVPLIYTSTFKIFAYMCVLTKNSEDWQD